MNVTEDVSAQEVRRVVEELAKMMKNRRIRLIKGHSGTFYIVFYNEEANGEEPFQCIELPEQ